MPLTTIAASDHIPSSMCIIPEPHELESPSVILPDTILPNTSFRLKLSLLIRYVLFSATKYAVKYELSTFVITPVEFPFSSFSNSTLSTNPHPSKSYPISYKYCAASIICSSFTNASSGPITYPWIPSHKPCTNSFNFSNVILGIAVKNPNIPIIIIINNITNNTIPNTPIPAAPTPTAVAVPAAVPAPAAAPPAAVPVAAAVPPATAVPPAAVPPAAALPPAAVPPAPAAVPAPSAATVPPAVLPALAALPAPSAPAALAELPAPSAPAVSAAPVLPAPLAPDAPSVPPAALPAGTSDVPVSPRFPPVFFDGSCNDMSFSASGSCSPFVLPSSFGISLLFTSVSPDCESGLFSPFSPSFPSFCSLSS